MTQYKGASATSIRPRRAAAVETADERLAPEPPMTEVPVTVPEPPLTMPEAVPQLVTVPDKRTTDRAPADSADPVTFYAAELKAGTVLGVRKIKREIGVGTPKAQLIRKQLLAARAA